MPTGLFVTHPITGAQVEVWVGNYVLMSYGDGAVMGVPAHDERDFAFAKKYNLPIQQVVAVDGETFCYRRLARVVRRQAKVRLRQLRRARRPDPQASRGQSGRTGRRQGPGREENHLAPARLGHQPPALLGTPIPIIHCEDCGAQPVPEKDLPVVLPQDLVPDGSGNPLVKSEAFHAGVVCPCCGKPARRETDTMDTFVDSSWYFMRYCDAQEQRADGGRRRRLLDAHGPVHRRH